jgi:hypothetical protein
MRYAAFAVAAPLALAASLAASTASANGAYLTLRSSTGTVVAPRMPISSFSSTQPATPPSTSGDVAPPIWQATFDVRSSANLAVYFDLINRGVVGAVIEFTTPDARGVERVSSIAMFPGVRMQQVIMTTGSGSFSAGYTFAYQAVRYAIAQPPPPGTRELALPAPPPPMAIPAGKALPSFSQPNGASTAPITVGTQTVPTVDTVFFSSPAVAGLPALSHEPVTSFTIDFMQPVSGASATNPTFNPFAIDRATSTSLFAAALAAKTPIPAATVSLEHKNADGTTTPVLLLEMRSLTVSGDNMWNVHGVSDEHTSFFYGAARITDAVTHAVVISRGM